MKEFKRTKVFPKYEHDEGDDHGIYLIFDNDAVISIDRDMRCRYSDELVMSREEMEANALLISKAPEMLFLLKDLLSDKGLNDVSRREVELLIKQATEL